MRHFIYQDEKSHKFWAVEQQGNELHISWGKVGTQGQSQVKNFADVAAAEKAKLKLIAEKTKKGYVEKIQSTTDRREYHLRPTQKYIDYYNISYSYLSTVVQRVNKRFPKEDVKKLEQMLTIISNELMPELNLENNPEAPEEKKTAR